MPKKTAIVVHHTYSNWGNVDAVRSWHQERGWRDIGYHYLIGNGHPTYSSWASGKRIAEWDGKIEAGREPDTSVGAHVKEGQMNTRSIGVSLVGNFDSYLPTDKQMEAVILLCARLCRKHGISTSEIYYHRDWAVGSDGKPYKSCPGTKFISRAKFRQLVAEKIRKLESNPARPGDSPLLIINGATIPNATFADGSWEAGARDVCKVIGAPMPDGNPRTSVRSVIACHDFKIVAANNRIKQRNRYDLRVAKVS